MGPDRPALSHSGLWCPAPGRSRTRPAGPVDVSAAARRHRATAAAGRPATASMCWRSPARRKRRGALCSAGAGCCWAPLRSGTDGRWCHFTCESWRRRVATYQRLGSRVFRLFSGGRRKQPHKRAAGLRRLDACGGWTRSSVDMDAHATTDSSSKLQATSSGSYLQFNTRSLSRLCFGSSMMLAHLFLTTFFPSGLEHYSVSLN